MKINRYEAAAPFGAAAGYYRIFESFIFSTFITEKQRKTMNKYQVGLTIATILGIASLVIGAFDLASTFGYLLNFKVNGYGSVGKGTFGQAGLILCELIITLAFSIAGALFAGLATKINGLKGVLIFLGVSRLFLLFLILGIYWKTGWHYVLDPAGRHIGAYLILFLSLLQGIAFFPIFKGESETNAPQHSPENDEYNSNTP